jgi:hypothetical protein
MTHHYDNARRYLPALATLLLAFLVLSFLPPVAFATCTAPKNPIEAENCLPGTPASRWYVQAAGSPNIQGFATDASVNVGQTIFFKISTSATSYRIDIYRLGYYQGNGARFITSISVSLPQPQIQPSCLTDSTTGLVDCGNWGISASWTVPSTATSGIYFVRLVRLDTGEVGAIDFVVRNDASHSDILDQTSDTTWQAYNDWGGHSLYGPTGAFDIHNRAYKVSYNRPGNAMNSFFIHEFPLFHWLEANGYDVSYFSGVDTDRSGALITQHKLFMSLGHDEYWSGGQRANVEAARAAGVNLAFFSGDEVSWKTRWEPSIDGTHTPYRTLVCYKERDTGAIDPLDSGSFPIWTGRWRDPRFSPPADGGRPTNALTGTSYEVGNPQNNAITVPQADGRMRFWRNTGIATLGPGQVYTLPTGTLGYEWDEDSDNGFRPAGLIDLSTTTVAVSTYLYFSPTPAPGYYYTGNANATHHMTLYRAPSGALVFGAGTVDYSGGVDSSHAVYSTTPPDPNLQQATVNVLADMGVQPATLRTGLVPATASADFTPPTSAIISPPPGTTVTAGSQMTILGTAQDFGGGVVGGVEVSVDGGATWHPAVGRENWSYVFTPATSGTLNALSRAVDDSGNLEVLGPRSPTITTQPGNQTVTAGQTATFTAAATGSPTPTVQWQVSTAGSGTFSNVSGAGATSTTLSFTTALSQTGNQYRAVFTNSAGTATTTAAMLTVNAAPSPSGTVTLQNANSNLCIDTGGATGFSLLSQASCSGAGSQSFTLQPAPVSGYYYLVNTASQLCWDFQNGSSAPGTLLQQYTCTALRVEYFQLSPTSLGTYQVISYFGLCIDVVGGSTAPGAHLEQNTCIGSANQTFNIVGSVPSNPTPPTITTQPGNQAVTAGQTATFTAAATGSPTPTVQWQMSTAGSGTFSNVSGATSTTLSFTTALSQNGNQYLAVFTNSAGTAPTTAATLTVNPATTKVPIQYEPENLMSSSVSSGPTYRAFAWSGFTDGNGTILDAAKVGDNVTITLNVPQAGTYDVKVAVKMFSSRGIMQLSLNGTNVGPATDQYVSSSAWAEFDIGNTTFSSSGSQPFKFTVVGKNSASSGYSISFDYIKLTPQ